MKNPLVLYLLAIASTILIISCENPSQVEEDDLTFYGQIVNKQGKPVEGAKIHYKSELKEKLLKGRDEICPSTIISFQIPERIYVEIKVYQWYTKNYLFTLVNDTLNSGSYSYSALPKKLTNGFYVYELTTKDTVITRTMYIQIVDWGELSQTEPLAITNNEGKFEIPIGLFGFDIELTKSSADGSGKPIKMSISRTIEIIVYEEEATFPSLAKEITIEEHKNVYKTFTLTTTP